MWWFFAPAIVAAGAAGYFLFSRMGSKLVLYTLDFGDAANIALNTMPSDWSKRSFTSVNDLLEKIDNHPGKLSRLIIIAHGGPDWFYSRGLTPEALGRVAGPKMASGGILGLAGCSSGRSPAEPAVWDAPAFGPGGAQSYAGRLRDTLRSFGAPYLGWVRAHTLEGGAVTNSAGRYFPFWQEGQPGIGVMPVGTNYQDWIDQFTGEQAYLWITGQD